MVLGDAHGTVKIEGEALVLLPEEKEELERKHAEEVEEKQDKNPFDGQ